MDRLLSLFGLYDFLGYIFTGGALIAGAVWGLAGVPHEPSATVVLGLIIASYLAGHLVQSLAVLWEDWWWKAKGGWPSVLRMTEGRTGAYEPPFRELIVSGLAATGGDRVKELAPKRLFALARADLRAEGLDARAEMLNALYALCRGFATVGAVLTIEFAVIWIARGADDRLGPATATALVVTVLFLLRFNRFGYYFADQVWQDYAASIGRRVEPATGAPASGGG